MAGSVAKQEKRVHWQFNGTYFGSQAPESRWEFTHEVDEAGSGYHHETPVVVELLRVNGTAAVAKINDVEITLYRGSVVDIPVKFDVSLDNYDVQYHKNVSLRVVRIEDG